MYTGRVPALDSRAGKTNEERRRTDRCIPRRRAGLTYVRALEDIVGGSADLCERGESEKEQEEGYRWRGVGGGRDGGGFIDGIN